MTNEKYVRILSSAGHAIDIDLKCVLIADEASISFQFDFDWNHHSESCGDCRALLNSIAPIGNEELDDGLTWYAFFDGKFKIIDFFRFGDANDPDQGYLSFSSRSPNFQDEGKYTNPNEALDTARVRLALLPLESGALEPEKLISEFYGNTRRCDYLNRAQREN
jgi:hypothetical protein